MPRKSGSGAPAQPEPPSWDQEGLFPDPNPRVIREGVAPDGVSVRRVHANMLCIKCCERVHPGGKGGAPARVAYQVVKDGQEQTLCFEHTYEATGRG